MLLSAVIVGSCSFLWWTDGESSPVYPSWTYSSGVTTHLMEVRQGALMNFCTFGAKALFLYFTTPKRFNLIQSTLALRKSQKRTMDEREGMI
jgi:dTDP-4-dehydrorhamnose 3,5-epimerase-like enzyme